MPEGRKEGKSLKVEVRGESVHISGYVNAVERDSRMLHDRDGRPFVERAESGVFKRALARAGDVMLKLNHSRDIGSVSGGNLKLREDAVGLYAEATVTDPETVREARAGHLTGWSFGFNDLAPSYEEQEGTEVRKRTLRDIDLEEVSILTITPAYIATSIEARSEGGVSEIRSIADKPEVRTNDHAVHMAENIIKRLKLEE